MTKVDEWLGEKFNQEILWDVDSLAFCRTEWKTQELNGGLQLRKSTVKLWESVQSISYVNYSPVMFTTNIGYTGSEATVGDIATACNKDAIFAINAGSFKNGKPTDMFKFDNQYVNDQVSLAAEAIFGLVPTKISDDITLVSTTLTANVDDHAQYNSAMVTGSLIVRNGKALKATDFPEDEFYTTRMARTFVGTAASGNTILCTIDGGVVGQAEGVTAAEAAFIAQHMGLKTAALLSCGDDATVWSSANGVENAPSAGTAQKVGSVIYISPGTVTVKGDGSQSNPFLIENYVHMMILRSLCPASSETYFRLEADIDMSAIKLWTPLNYDAPFGRKIHFDGNGKTLSNFAPESFVKDDQVTAAPYASLFGVLNGTVKNLTVTDAKVIVPLTQGSATGVIGGFIGTVQDNVSFPGTIENVKVLNAEVQGGRDLGLIGGQARDAIIKNSYVSGKISAGSQDVGGFIGRLAGDFVIEDSHADVYIAPGQLVEKNFRYGGLLGFCATIGGTDYTRDKLTVRRCSASGTIFSDTYSANTAGSLIAYVNTPNSEISECYSTVRVAGGKIACVGMIGIANVAEKCNISNCYTTCAEEMVTNQKVAGILGQGEKGVITIENCYSDYKWNGYSGIGGMVGVTVAAATVNVNNCIAWNPYITINRETGDKHGSGAIAGNIQGKCTITGCLRNPEMVFTDPFGRTLENHADIADGTPANIGGEGTSNPAGTSNQNSFDGMPASSTNLCEVAQAAGWSTSIWDFSGAVPVLAWQK